MAKRRSKTSTTKSQIEDTFQDLDVTLNDGLEVVEEIEESQEIEEIVEEVVVEEKPAPAPKKAAKVESKAPGVYYKGELVDVITHQSAKGWRGFIKGKKVLGAPSDFEVVK